MLQCTCTPLHSTIHDMTMMMNIVRHSRMAYSPAGQNSCVRAATCHRRRRDCGERCRSVAQGVRRVLRLFTYLCERRSLCGRELLCTRSCGVLEVLGAYARVRTGIVQTATANREPRVWRTENCVLQASVSVMGWECYCAMNGRQFAVQWNLFSVELLNIWDCS